MKTQAVSSSVVRELAHSLLSDTKIVSSGVIVAKASPSEVYTLARYGMVDGLFKRRQGQWGLEWLRLVEGVTARDVLRFLNRTAPEASQSQITRRRQDKGAKHWIVRLDNADSGHAGRTVKTIWRAAA